MSKLNTFAAVLKFINGRNDGADSLKDVCDYTTDKAKTKDGMLVATQGCSLKHPVEDMLANKRLHNKTHGKQYEHFVLAPCPNGSDKSPEDILKVTKEIVATVYPENMAVITVHTDTQVVHAHTVLDAVNAVTGRKFSQSPSDLNRVKQKANSILKKHGFEIITASANDIVDHTDHSAEEGFDFLELDELQFLNETAMPEISAYIDNSSCYDDYYDTLKLRENISTFLKGGNTMGHQNQCVTGLHPIPELAAPTLPVETNAPTLSRFKSCDWGNKNLFVYKSKNPQTLAFVSQKPESEVLPAIVPASNNFAPKVSPPQDSPVPATVETAVNSYPNTMVSTGPVFRIHGTPDSNFAGLNELVEQTADYAQEHQNEAAKLALAMQQHGQQSGYPSNVSVYAGPIFDIDMTGYGFPPDNDPHEKF